MMYVLIFHYSNAFMQDREHELGRYATLDEVRDAAAVFRATYPEQNPYLTVEVEGWEKS